MPYRVSTGEFAPDNEFNPTRLVPDIYSSLASAVRYITLWGRGGWIYDLDNGQIVIVDLRGSTPVVRHGHHPESAQGDNRQADSMIRAVARQVRRFKHKSVSMEDADGSIVLLEGG